MMPGDLAQWDHNITFCISAQEHFLFDLPALTFQRAGLGQKERVFFFAVHFIHICSTQAVHQAPAEGLMIEVTPAIIIYYSS
jgi:hypothetical protein